MTSQDDMGVYEKRVLVKDMEGRNREPNYPLQQTRL